MNWGIDIQIDDLTDLVDQEPVGGQVEPFTPMRLQRKSGPNVSALIRLSPVACAMPRVLQCVAAGGVVSRARTTRCST